MVRLRSRVSRVVGSLLLILTVGCSSRPPGDAFERILAAREPYVGRYRSPDANTKAADLLDVRADGMLEHQSPGVHAFTAAWEPLDDRRILARPNGASWHRVYTLQPPAAKPGYGTFTAVDQTE